MEVAAFRALADTCRWRQSSQGQEGQTGQILDSEALSSITCGCEGGAERVDRRGLLSRLLRVGGPECMGSRRGRGNGSWSIECRCEVRDRACRRVGLVTRVVTSSSSTPSSPARSYSAIRTAPTRELLFLSKARIVASLSSAVSLSSLSFEAPLTRPFGDGHLLLFVGERGKLFLAKVRSRWCRHCPAAVRGCRLYMPNCVGGVAGFG